MGKHLPGDLSAKEEISRMLRVNQAGEYGAVRIYKGQMDALKGRPCEEQIYHMQEQEKVHLATFDQLLAERRIRPTILFPIWHLAGYALGYVTAKMGEKAAMACTVAVEETIDAHYAEQIKYLEDIPEEKGLQTTIHEFRLEELEHRDISLQHGAEQAPAYHLLSSGIKAVSRLAIWLSKRI